MVSFLQFLHKNVKNLKKFFLFLLVEKKNDPKLRKNSFFPQKKNSSPIDNSNTILIYLLLHMYEYMCKTFEKRQNNEIFLTKTMQKKQISIAENNRKKNFPLVWKKKNSRLER